MYYSGNRVQVILGNELLQLESTKPIEPKAWNTVHLEAKSTLISLKINDAVDEVHSEIPLSYVSGISLGDKKKGK